MSTPLATALWLVPLVFATLWRPRGAPSGIAIALMAVYALVGAWTLWFDVYGLGTEPAGFAHWKPTVLYWSLAAVAGLSPLLGLGYPARILIGSYFTLSNREWRWINAGVATLCAVLGAVNLIVASRASDRDWVGFKYSCQMTLLIIILLRLNFVWLPILADVSIHAWRHATAAWRYLKSLY